MGVLGGRFKRRWLLDRSQKNAERAIQLYTDALTKTEADDEVDQDQVFYHAINIAFMALAAEGDKKKTEKYAKKALAACALTEESIWRSATEGEANLYLGNSDAAIEGYQAALDKNPEPRQIMSMFQQAVQVAEIQRDDALAERLRALFRENEA